MTGEVLSVRPLPLPPSPLESEPAQLPSWALGQEHGLQPLSVFAGGPFGLSVHPVLLGCCIEVGGSVTTTDHSVQMKTPPWC